MDHRPQAHTDTAGDGERLISSTKKNAAQQRPVLLHRSGKQKLNSTILARARGNHSSGLYLGLNGLGLTDEELDERGVEATSGGGVEGVVGRRLSGYLALSMRRSRRREQREQRARARVATAGGAGAGAGGSVRWRAAAACSWWKTR
jgi:hypothetical protein